MLSKYASLALTCLMIGCGSEAESPGTTAAADSGAVVDSGSESDSAPVEDGGADTHGAVDVAPPASNVTLEIQSATYKSSTAAGGGFVHAVVFSLVNTSSVAVTSLQTAEWDFGGGKKVQLTKPPCSGMFPIAAGAKRTVDVQIVVGNSGNLSNFSIICSPSQHFGGASGTAPPDATFSAPIAIKVAGNTASGTFSATGSAAPK